MKSKQQIEIYKKIDADLIATTLSKSADYAGGGETDADVLSNFKNVSQAAKNLGIDISKPEQYALFMVILKIARLTNLINSGKTPNNESVKDSFLDGINYFKLALCCYTEETETEVKKEIQ